MKKYIRLLVVLVLTLTVVGVARNSPAWASSLLTSEQPSGAAQPPLEIDTSESGSFYVGGVCQFNAVYTGTGASAHIAVNIPAKESREVPYSYQDKLYLGGCHVVHSTLGKVTSEMNPAFGNWEVCFGDRPDEKLTIYYYLDDPGTGKASDSAVWRPLPTTVKDGLACAPAIYTGVYAPGGRRLNDNNDNTGSGGDPGSGPNDGTVRPPSFPSITITQSGTYSVGGICTIVVEYYIPKLSNVVHVEENIEISDNVPYPDNDGLLYLPGCHVFHYKENILRPDTNRETSEGFWEICFAAVPNKETTIYYYYANADTGEVNSIWSPLETTTENGMACAKGVDHTAVYAPSGK